MATEKLKIRLEFYATMWDRPPHVEIIVAGETKVTQDITGTENSPDIIEFEHVFEEEKAYDLVIKRSGKSGRQTVVNEKGDILKDQLLHIKKIEIDEINIGALVYEGVYRPDYPEPWATQQRDAGHELPYTFKNATIIGHNGSWTFNFSSPFYMWLLENLY